MGPPKIRKTHTRAQAVHQPCVLVSRIPKPYHTLTNRTRAPAATGRQEACSFWARPLE